MAKSLMGSNDRKDAKAEVKTSGQKMLYRINRSWFGEIFLLFPLMILLGELIFLVLLFSLLIFHWQFLDAKTFEYIVFPILPILCAVISCAFAVKFEFSGSSFVLFAIGWKSFALAWLILAVLILMKTPVDERSSYIRRQNRIAALAGAVGLVWWIGKVILGDNFV